MSSSSRLLPRALATSSTRRLYVLAIAAASFRTISAGQTYRGCFSSSGSWEDQGFYRYQTYDTCQPACSDNGDAVYGLSDGSTCWCGNKLPPLASKVADSMCSTPCDGYGKDTCGGDGYYAAYLTGLKPEVPYANGGSSDGTSATQGSSTSSSSPSSTSSSTHPTHVSTHVPHSTFTQIVGGTTIFRTVAGSDETGTPAPTSSGNSGGTNVGGIAAGVSVGVVGLAAIVAGVYFFLRRRRQQQQSEMSMRQSQVSDFMQGGRIPPGSAYSQMSDSRLEPECGNQRNSVGSIADAQDYSRRILRVANPDSS